MGVVAGGAELEFEWEWGCEFEWETLDSATILMLIIVLLQLYPIKKVVYHRACTVVINDFFTRSEKINFL